MAGQLVGCGAAGGKPWSWCTLIGIVAGRVVVFAIIETDEPRATSRSIRRPRRYPREPLRPRGPDDDRPRRVRRRTSRSRGCRRPAGHSRRTRAGARPAAADCHAPSANREVPMNNDHDVPDDLRRELITRVDQMRSGIRDAPGSRRTGVPALDPATSRLSPPRWASTAPLDHRGVVRAGRACGLAACLRDRAARRGRFGPGTWHCTGRR
jgi:hypothetical protein